MSEPTAGPRIFYVFMLTSLVIATRALRVDLGIVGPFRRHLASIICLRDKMKQQRQCVFPVYFANSKDLKPRAWHGIACAFLALGLMSISARAEELRRSSDFISSGIASRIATSYRLGPLDKVRIRAYSWRPSRDEIFEWTAINENQYYTIGSTGAVSIPLAGEVAAAGLTSAEFAKVVAKRIKAQTGIAVSPNVAVEIFEFRPFYVIGDVDKPGEYPFRPGLTVVQAAAVAGGPVRNTLLGALRSEREVITSEGELKRFRAELLSHLARKARLQTELKNRQQIEFPKELSERRSDPTVAIVLSHEAQIFEARLNGLKTQIDALEKLRSYLEQEVAFLAAQVKAIDDEVQAVDEELRDIRSLHVRKLVSDARLLGVERTRAQVERDRLRLQSSAMRVKQDISKAEISIIEIRNTRNSEVSEQIAETEAQIEQLVHRINTTEELMGESQINNSRHLSDLRKRRFRLEYKILRRVDGLYTEISTDEGAAVVPGDTVRVEKIRTFSSLNPVSTLAPLIQ